ncbi:MAG: methylenetetrahydrofolate--tRNA-(uracil(54)-C(5))-methyltransferase (FADH(2)-oxidizing) TrmFO [Nitrospirae bacterium]|nr:methylenetetrahydrofolate--tRNA-(uracil(54)-C(5))-methyltransferase (FADH(2)-oxidizing) TrmFO [Nitrospirota bacterium]
MTAEASHELTVVGGGLAGSEAAWQAAQLGVRVRLCEMRPANRSPVHVTDSLAELVCSNSFKAKSLENGPGLLKEEMILLDSLILDSALKNEVPAGAALAVDRNRFAETITQRVASHPNIELVREEIKTLPPGPVIIATGPLTSPDMTEILIRLTQGKFLYFFDAISPIVETPSINMEKCFKASRWQQGEGDYINCPMTKEEYYAFIDTLLKAEAVPLKPFEKPLYFEGCLPIEEMARRGPDTLAFGPMKPVGLMDPHTGHRPFAVVQLRPEDPYGQLHNIVGFQTKLKYPEQTRVFRTIPGLEGAQFARHGSVHRNTFINSPLVLKPHLELRGKAGVFVAGQLVGVEGYIESAAMGLIAGINAARLLRNDPPAVPPPTTAIGALIQYITTSDPKHFQPMNINYGLLPPLFESSGKRHLHRREIADRALEHMKIWKNQTLPERQPESKAV